MLFAVIRPVTAYCAIFDFGDGENASIAIVD